MIRTRPVDPSWASDRGSAAAQLLLRTSRGPSSIFSLSDLPLFGPHHVRTRTRVQINYRYSLSF